MGVFVTPGRAEDLAAACRKTKTVVLTTEHVGAGAKGATGAGWTRNQLALFGVPWPPPKGWRRELVGKSFAGKVVAEFIKHRTAGRVEPTPFTVVCGDPSTVRVVVYVKDYPNEKVVVDKDGMAAAVRNWVDNGTPLVLSGVERVELFQIKGA